MPYFAENAKHLTLREGHAPNTGLRRGQVGALYALAAHIIERHDPALISLPTGYGKTAVLTAACFLAQARRVLVVTPTSTLRAQAARAFRTLDTLRRLSALPGEDALPAPRVAVIEERMTSQQQWQALGDCDVAVCTPHSASPDIEGVEPPPVDMFDLVLVDEGHHSPARTWAAFIRATPNARHVLLSATPFRRDRRQLPGRLIFYYSLRQAVAENAFGKVTFNPVIVDEDALPDTRDAALVAKAVEIFRRDAAAGLQHRLLARTERIADAERVAQRYADAGLRVEAVSSRRSKQQIEDIERRLVAGELDGVVCVDMFGEGYDFPKFKIAVLHSAHKSLVPTLQFIGRFARTNDEQTGTATFLAVPREVDAESSELYRDGVDWDVLLADVVEARQQLALQQRETLQSFAQTGHPHADYEAVNPGAFRLSQHIAVYRTGDAPDFSEPPETLKSLQVTNGWLSDDHSTYLLLAKSVKSPAWYREEHLVDAAHACFLIKFFPASRLLFITATERSERYYAELVEFFFGGNASPLAYDQIRKVLNGMTDQEFYSVGIRSTSPTATTESYRIVAGSNADRGVRDTDAANFSQGHFMGRGQVNGESEVIGASAGGRIWSNGKLSIPEILDWMTALHGRMTANQVNIGRSGLDLLPFGETLERIPASTCMTDWPKVAYRDNPQVLIGEGADRVVTSLLDLQITNVTVNGDGSALTFRIGDDVRSQRVQYRLHRRPNYGLLDENPPIRVSTSEGNVSIEEWLDEHGLVFFTKEMDSFVYGTLQRRLARTAIRPESLVPHDWTGCQINVEFDTTDPDRMTVQRFLQDHLIGVMAADFIIYDHRSGEAADFIVGKVIPGNRLAISLYHCKGAGGPVSGERVDDVYELAGQSVKSARFQRKDELLRHIERRTQARPNRGHSPFLVGTRDAAIDLVRAYDPIAISLSVHAVQPGLLATGLAENVRAVMAAANDSLTAQGVELRWLVS
ncbi:Superfamily II DNA or RNA helicase [Ralstonia sp. 25mfcol4.1]|uniref:DEAD/DEAH box helicase n=1 Tax=Ralstonia sp. 25mfcol4.1 TaxID=1761899 RepID=UPI0008821049|nr:DEAD/DEAH box helicase family protein [Ralstonia sp. 25mfcol4.1]SDP35840.1 Superfamily II DNA or RNA helicase [Ralstonia sp. 25mfcol4.1]